MSYDASWDDNHHSSSLPRNFENNIGDVYTPNITEKPMDSLSIHDVDSEKNLANIEETISLDILINPGVVENVHIGASCSLDEVIKPLFKDFETFFPRPMKRCQVLIQISYYMRSKHILMLPSSSQ